MLATYCTNPECPEVEVAKEVLSPEQLEGPIRCGGCGNPTTEPAEVEVEKGERIR